MCLEMVILKGGPLKGDLTADSMKSLYTEFGDHHLKSPFYTAHNETDLEPKIVSQI